MFRMGGVRRQSWRTCFAGGKTSVDQAASVISGLVRYVDLLDSYMAPGGACMKLDGKVVGKIGVSFTALRWPFGYASQRIP
jgi:hypothetical protein